MQYTKQAADDRRDGDCQLPVRREIMLSTKTERTCSKRTICEVHRQIYDLVVLDPTNPKIKELLNEAFVLGIDLVKKLVEYKCSLPNWEKNLDFDEIKRIRELRIQLDNKERLGIDT